MNSRLTYEEFLSAKVNFEHSQGLTCEASEINPKLFPHQRDGGEVVTLAQCSLPDCAQPVKSKGFCKRHYQQQWRTGSPEIIRSNPHGTLEERFWRYVTVATNEKCWLWTGFRDDDGYGKFRWEARNIGAHVASWRLHFGEIPAGLLIRHACNNPPCVNPWHLRPGTHDDNMRDRLLAGHYAKGEAHPMVKFSDEVVKAVRAASGTYTEISVQFMMSISQVGNIRRGDQRS